MQKLADQIEGVIGGTSSPVVENLQVAPLLMWNPSPPVIDMYPGDPFQEQIGMSAGNRALYLTVRARVDTPDREGAQELLLAMMDPQGSASVEQAILSDTTLGGAVSDMAVDGPTNFGAFDDPGGGGRHLGCTWQVQVLR